MSEEVYITILFDYYEELLTEKQKQYFKYYYFDNLSLSEIALAMNVSRNAVHKELKTISLKLKFYEDKLHLYDKENKIIKILEKCDDDIKNDIYSVLNKK